MLQKGVGLLRVFTECSVHHSIEDQPEQRMQVGCDVDEDGHYHYTIVTTVNSGFRPDKEGKDTDAVFSPAVAACRCQPCNCTLRGL